MQPVHGLAESHADSVARALLESLTPNNSLETEAENTGVIGAYVRINVGFAERLDVTWFDIDTLWADTKTNTLAFVSASYFVKDGVPNIYSDCYDVNLKKGKGKQYIASGMNTRASDVYDEIPFTQPKAFQQPVTRAMQIHERIERGLKVLFES